MVMWCIELHRSPANSPPHHLTSSPGPIARHEQPREHQRLAIAPLPERVRRHGDDESLPREHEQERAPAVRRATMVIERSRERIESDPPPDPYRRRGARRETLWREHLVQRARVEQTGREHALAEFRQIVGRREIASTRPPSAQVVLRRL